MRINVVSGLFEGMYGGLDFAVTKDHSAFCIIDAKQPQNPAWDYHEAVNAKRLKRELGSDYSGADYNERVPRYLPWVYTIASLRRYNPGDDIKTKITPSVQQVISSPEVQDAGGIRIAADATSMQKYIVKDLQHGEDARLRDTHEITGVSITTGQGESKGYGGFRNVSKNRLIGLAKHLLAQRRLVVNPQLEHAGLLVDELRNFVPKLTAAGNVTWEADTREGKHDDLILATSLALWLAAKGREPEHGAPAVFDLSRHVG